MKYEINKTDFICICRYYVILIIIDELKLPFIRLNTINWKISRLFFPAISSISIIKNIRASFGTLFLSLFTILLSILHYLQKFCHQILFVGVSLSHQILKLRTKEKSVDNLPTDSTRRL